MKKNIALACILSLFLFSTTFAQNSKSDELLTFSKSAGFKEAIRIFKNIYSEKKGKVLLDFSQEDGPLEIEIEKMHWEVALKSILQFKGLELESIDDAVIIRKSQATLDEEIKEIQSAISGETDEVLIEITFFEADSKVLNEVGIDWSTLVDGEVTITADANKNASSVSEDIFKLTYNQAFDAGDYTVDLNTVFKVFESDGHGHILARPQLVVKSGQQGFVQDGVDFSIKTVDDAGNVSDKFFQSGIIVTVTPTIVMKDDKKYVSLKVAAEKSSAKPDPVSTQILKSKIETIKLLFNGEETVIGGLTSKEEAYVRKGIPFLKDLPWWVLGIKYLTGYNSKSVTNKELLILLKATVLTNVDERMNNHRDYELDIKEMRRGLPAAEKKLLQEE